MVGKCSFPDCIVEGNLAAIIFHPVEVLACDGHYPLLAEAYLRRKPFRNVSLGQTLEKWTHVDKQGNEKKHRITAGKAWEIDHRTLASDGKTVINKKTQKEAQY